MRHRRTAFVAVIVIAATAAACGVQTVADKTGDHTLVIRLGTIDTVLDPNRQTPAPSVFISTLERVSAGAITVQVVSPYGNGPTAESDMIAAIGRGDLDAGYPAVRAFAAAGLPGFEAVEAPFLVASAAAEDAISTGQVGRDLLRSLDGSAVVGLGIAPGPLRRPFGLTPLLNPADWKGQKVRDTNSPVQAQTITALGGTPVSAGAGFDQLVRVRLLQGAEIDVPQYAARDYGKLLPAVVRNVVLWPRMLVLTFNRKLVERLSRVQRGWLQQAADAAVQASLMRAADEITPAAQVCAGGVTFYDASTADVAALTSAVQPVLARISSDPVAGPLLSEVKEVVAAHPGVDVPYVPAGCLGH